MRLPPLPVPMAVADAGSRALSLLSPERAHELTIALMQRGVAPRIKTPANAMLRTTLAGLEFPNPVGLAAGFDKNARVPDAMLSLGFGFVEVGAVTPKPQAGNARPRVFRLHADKAVINRYGFNNDGMEAIAARLAARNKTAGAGAIVGINLGANKDSLDRAGDYVTGLRRLDGLVDFYTVNISSPNTPGLRALQDRGALMALMARVLEARDLSQHYIPVFLKIAPDLTDTDKADIADTVRALGIDAVIISNTTLARTGLRSRHSGEAGGLSGAPLLEMSTRVLGEFYQALDGTVPLIGVGGIASARDAYNKITTGASLVQLYTALIYHGPGLVARIVAALPDLLRVDGFASIEDAVGARFR